MKIKKWDWLICLVVAAALMLFVFDLPGTAPQARIYPMVVLGGSYLMLLIIFISWAIAKKKGKIAQTESMEVKRVIYIAGYCVSILAYIFLIEKVGFIVSTIVFGIFSLIYMKNKNKIVIVILPVALTFILYYVFANFLFVTLPSGILM